MFRPEGFSGPGVRLGFSGQGLLSGLQCDLRVHETLAAIGMTAAEVLFFFFLCVCVFFFFWGGGHAGSRQKRS